MKEVYLVRPGETHYSVGGLIEGQDNLKDRLTGVGRLEVRNLGLLLREAVGSNSVQILSSDLIRARETTGILMQQIGSRSVLYKGELRERDFGVLEGKPWSRVNGLEKGLYASDFKEGETLAEVTARAAGIAESARLAIVPVLIIVGDKWINSYIANILKGEEPVLHEQDPAKVHYFWLGDDGKVLECLLNDEFKRDKK